MDYKFRAKSKAENKWVFGAHLKEYQQSYIITYSVLGQIKVRVIPETVGLMLGKISIGDEVYEGDLIQHGETVRKVELIHGNTCLVRKNRKDYVLLSMSPNAKKVGNVFDSPEIFK